MPILNYEPDCFPSDLLTHFESGQSWWLCYTRARQEKQLMRCLREVAIGHYSPVIGRRYRSPAGRLRESFSPLFANYVFLCGDEQARYQAVSTGCISRVIPVTNTQSFVEDLRQIQRLIETGAPLSPEARIESGDRVRVKSGQFAGFEGVVIRRAQQTCLIVEVRFMNQGASVALDDCQLEVIERVVN